MLFRPFVSIAGAAILLASAASAQPKPPAGAGAIALQDCLRDASPATILESRQLAEKTIKACSAALQSRSLTPAEIAQARLNRGAARTALGDALLATGDYLEALRHYDSAINPNNPDALQLYRAAAALEGVGKADAALTKYDAAIKADPKLALAYYGRGILLATRERAYNRAIADFDRVLTLDPANTHALVHRGEAYSQVGDFGHALADLNRAIQLDPRDAGALVVRGLVQQRRNAIDLALADFDAALKINPRDQQALRNRGALRAAFGHQDQAIEDFNAVIQMNRNDPSAFFNRGYAHFGKHEYELAVMDYSTALYLDPTLGPAYLNRCLTRTIQGKELVMALADCDQALKLLPLSIPARETRGFIYLKLGDPAIAITEYEAALQMDANRPLALYGLGLAKIRMGRKDEGEANQAAARALSPDIAKQFSVYGVE
ncbi:MAG TPA: tetratricopeptide repeat protein [Reyranella sp.]|jgi:tetratricopeptide (TPR) repeat protein